MPEHPPYARLVHTTHPRSLTRLRVACLGGLLALLFFFSLKLYMLTIGLLGFCLMAYDKRAAVMGKWRVPEKRLLIVALLGAAPAMTLAMVLFRHKSAKLSIAIPLLVFSCLHLLLAGALLL